ncbi:LPD29 domain-containing protein [Dysgonomonas sp. GY75]|uniref:LPD29 domain-containing protein n=1 Tax=Dysgonomonas sp. GY75 TaxID=2780419 RepID=UPI003977CE9F
MKYFSTINSLAELKKQYRKLAVQNHPDKGGTTEAMQQINLEFGKLFAVWKNDMNITDTATGYENDYTGASAREYTGYVYNEYRFRGGNYKGQRPAEVVEIVRKWLKETYPHYKFSVRRRDYHCISIHLLKADFEPFKKDSKYTNYKELNRYYLEKDADLTDRALEVMQNILSYANSYNFDDSDAMTDYFHVNFYLNISIGNGLNPYKLEIPGLKAPKGTVIRRFSHPEGAAHKAIRQALGKDKFALYETRRHGNIMALGKSHLWEDGSGHFYPLSYSSLKTAQKRLDKLQAAGIACKTTSRNGSAT